MGLISLLFLLAYASAQLVAGSKALHVLFGWPGWAGAVMGATLVVLYCFAGGIRASICFLTSSVVMAGRLADQAGVVHQSQGRDQRSCWARVKKSRSVTSPTR
mgnify:CR=1 FL=1